MTCDEAPDWRCPCRQTAGGSVSQGVFTLESSLSRVQVPTVAWMAPWGHSRDFRGWLAIFSARTGARTLAEVHLAAPHGLGPFSYLYFTSMKHLLKLKRLWD